MARTGILVVSLLLLISCGSEVSVSTTRNEAGGTEQSAATALAPEELGPTLAAYSHRLEVRIDRAAGEIEMG